MQSMVIMLNSMELTFYGWLCCYLLTSGISLTDADCGEFEWKCKSGQCIQTDEKCDGVVHCSDKTDEIAENCLGIDCPVYAFQCTYGACISGTAKCNGVNDCIDNSDESPVLCGTANETLTGGCREHFFQCKHSKECIGVEEACDGTLNCKDGSDETLEQCSFLKCPAFSFQCGYGACVSGQAKCDGTNDCADGSDESLELCGVDHTTRTPLPKPSQTAGPGDTQPTMTTITMRIPTTDTAGSCQVAVDDHTEVYHESDTSLKLKNGEWINNINRVLFKCQKRYVRFGSESSYCLDGKWQPAPPQCLRACNNAVLDGVTFKSSCNHNGTGVLCTDKIRPGTRATITCAVGYSKPPAPYYDVLVCLDDGEWDYHPAKCLEQCGQETVSATPFASGGESINITSVPWHAGIYKKKGDTYEHICGGTIISAKLVISAAHCFYKDQVWTKYAVVVGKYYRNYSRPEILETQVLSISQVQIERSYLDADGSYQNDIAIVVLSKFIRYRNYIKPICLENLDRSYRERDIKDGTNGKVAGWGRIGFQDDFSEDLQSVDLTVISKRDCLEKVGPKYNTFINNEKFCVGSREGEAATCQGDSGGGFIVAKDIGGIPTYYLWGIVSTSLSKQTCGLDYYVAFTNIYYHTDLIRDFMITFRPK